jgi:hypothetical protein
VSANFYCWESSLGLDPKGSDFLDRVEALHENAVQPPAPRPLAFVADLKARYPEDDDGTAEDPVWAAGPLEGEIIGQFINFAVTWSSYAGVRPFIVETAHRNGLHCYDPQEGIFFPLP